MEKTGQSMHAQRSKRIRLVAAIGIISAVAFIVQAIIKIPVVMFLKYEPKDIVFTLGGLILGPIPAFTSIVIASFIEMITVSETGIIGFAMNVIASSAFVLPVVIIYKHNRTKQGAIIGLITAVMSVAIVMVLWNYILTPIYMAIPREKVLPLIKSAILPFNLLKGSLNAAITFLLYKPVSTALKKYSIIHSQSGAAVAKPKYSPAMIVGALVVIATCVLVILSYQGII